MNRIRPIFQWIFGNRFWLTCLFTAIASAATWFMAWQAIESSREQQVTKIKSKKGSIEKVLKDSASSGSDEINTDAHPNDSTKLEMEKLIKLAADAALDAWKVRYDQQKDILKFAEAIPEHIRSVLANHQPMEKPFERELLEVTARSTFGEFFKRHMPGLIRSTINATWNYDETGVPLAELPKTPVLAKPDATVEPKTEDLVYWTDENQELWHSKVTEFVTYDDNKGPGTAPNTAQMLALQQDVWILEAVLKIVGKVNEGFVANDLAPVKRLDHILVGKDAMAATPEVLEPIVYQIEASGQAVAAKKQSRGLRTTGAVEESIAATKVIFDESASNSPFHGRYVDRNFTQLNKSEIEQILTDRVLSDRSYLAVAKRVPVRVAVKMDERKIADFIEAAANSPFTFEVRSLRINNIYVPNAGAKRESDQRGAAADDEPVRASGGGKGGGGNLFDGDGPADGDGGAKGGDSKGAVDEDVAPELRRSFDVRVEFLGIVKIYNPPDPTLFFPEQATETDDAGGSGIPDATAQK